MTASSSNTPPPSTPDRTQLLEHAALHVFGLLDEYDAALFERDFDHAIPALQGEVIELQAALASDMTVLPEEEPAPALRRRVLDAVTRAIEQEHSTLAPLATIGHQPTPIRTGGGHDEMAHWMRLNRAGAFWRAAAIVMAATVVIVSYFLLQAHQDANRIARYALSAQMGLLEKELGLTSTDMLFDDTGPRRLLAAASEKLGVDVKAIVYYSDDHDTGLLAIRNLPVGEEGQNYTLIVKHDDLPEERNVTRFQSAGRMTSVKFPSFHQNIATIIATATWTIVDSAGTVVLSSV